MSRTNFTDAQRAEIFVLDRATCSYSGRSLWIADFGIDPSFQIDWADHFEPASKGGKSIVENGVAAAWRYNYLHGSDRQKLLLFHRGLPTAEHTHHVGAIPEFVAAHLLKFAMLDISDWYLNRAVWHISLGVISDFERLQGATRSRGCDYYARASLAALTKWRRVAGRSSITSLEERGLYPVNPEPDQSSMLQIRQASSLTALTQLMKDLLPIYQAAANAIDALAEAETSKDILKAMRKAEKDKLVPKRIQTRLVNYARALQPLINP